MRGENPIPQASDRMFLHPFGLCTAGIPFFKKADPVIHEMFQIPAVYVMVEGLYDLDEIFLSPGQRERKFLEIEVVASVILLKVCGIDEARSVHKSIIEHRT